MLLIGTPWPNYKSFFIYFILCYSCINNENKVGKCNMSVKIEFNDIL